MEIRCYWDSNFKHCPYKKYIEELLTGNELSIERKKEIISSIEQKYERMKKCKDINCIEEVAKDLLPHEYHEIGVRKNNEKLIRIIFFYDKETNEIILLDGFEKPNKDNYNLKEKHDYFVRLCASDHYLSEYKKYKKFETYE